MIPNSTVVLFAYNASNYIAEAIKSILNQTYAEFELLIIEDKSTDDTLNQILLFKDKRIRLIKRAANAGIAANRQLALQEAKGKYIFWMDNDDVSHPARIASQVAFFEKNEAVVLCGTASRLIDENGAVTGVARYPLLDTEIKATMLFGFPFMSPSVGLRMSAIRPVHIECLGKVNQADDYTLYSSLMDAGKFANLPEVLYDYRVHKGIARITTDSTRSQDIINGRKEAWGIQFAAIGLSPKERLLDLHDKLTYYPQFISGDDLKMSGEYLRLLQQLKKSGASNSESYQRAIGKHISNLVARLLCLKKNGLWTSIQLQTEYHMLLTSIGHLRTIAKKLLKRGHASSHP